MSTLPLCSPPRSLWRMTLVSALTIALPLTACDPDDANHTDPAPVDAGVMVDMEADQGTDLGGDDDMSPEQDMPPSGDMADAGGNDEDMAPDMEVDMPTAAEGFDGILEGEWSRAFGVSGASGGIGAAVYSVTEGDLDGELYAGGFFGYMSGVEAQNVARWDGSSWQRLAEGVSLLVEALEWDGESDLLYAGGRDGGGGFGLPAPNAIKQWDGTSWSDLGFLDGEFSAVHVIKRLSDGRVAVGGRFDGIDGDTSKPALVTWDGSSWSAWGSALTSMDEVFEIIEDDSGRACIGGQFSPMFTQSVGVACWDDATSDWVGVIDGLPPGRVSALLPDGPNGELIAGGQFTYFNDMTGELRAGIARWDGTTWSALDGVAGGDVNSVRALAYDAQRNLFVGGRFGVVDPLDQALAVRSLATRTFDGQWAELGDLLDPLEVFVAGAAGAHDFALMRSGELAVAGIFVQVDDITTSGVSMRDTSGQWRALAPADAGFEGLAGVATMIAAASDGTVYIAGGFQRAGSVATPEGLAQWTGQAWEALGDGLGEFAAIAAIAVHPDTDDLWVLGDGLEVGGGATPGQIARWDGTSWQAVPGTTDGALGAIAFDGGDVYVSGDFSSIEGVDALDVARWDGTSWHAVGAGLGATPDEAVSHIAIGEDGVLWAIGNFSQGGDGEPIRGFATWDGAKWEEAGGGLTDSWSTLDLRVEGENVWVAGNFETASDGTTLNSIGRWDGTQWHALGDGLNSFDLPAFVTGIYPSGDQVIATGTFRFEDTGEESLAWWDGSAWRPIGQGMADLGEGLAMTDGVLWIAGFFNSVGEDTPSFGVARWEFDTEE